MKIFYYSIYFIAFFIYRDIVYNVSIYTETDSKLTLLDMFDKYIPDFRYDIIDIGQIDKNRLKRIKNAVSILLSLDMADEANALLAVHSVKELLKELPPDEKKLLFKHINSYLMVFARRTKMNIEEKDIYEEEEVNEEVFTRFEKLLKDTIKKERKEGIIKGTIEGIREGIIKGTREGREEGIREGIREGISLAIRIKFGKKYANSIDHLIKKMDIDKLNRLKELIEEMKTKEELEEKIDKELLN